MPRRTRIPFFTDNNVADSVGKAILSQGHELSRLRDCMPIDAKDPLVALACADGGQVLVSHDNDFKAIAKMLNITQRQYHQKLHRIQLRCFEPEAADRVLSVMKLIEAEWKIAKKAGHPMVIEISSTCVKVWR